MGGASWTPILRGGGWLGVAAVLAAGVGWAAPAVAQERAAPDPLPVVDVRGPTVIAFWMVPASDSVLAADPELASALDQQQYFWDASQAPLAAAGIAAIAQPGRRFRVREPGHTWIFTAARDSVEIGYLLVRPGKPARALYRLWYPADLMAAARRAFGMPERQVHQ